jgi:tRNA(Ile)-lysidine synthase
VLLRVVRGAGRRGLGGIHPRRGAIIRPLLLCDRVQVRHFLVAHGLGWCRDRSNFDYALARTRIRAGYLPALARELNPRLARALARLADVLRDEDALLDGIAATVPGVGDGIDLEVVRAIEPAIARRVLRRWWGRAGSGRRLGLGHVEAALGLARRAAGGGRVRVPGGWIVRTPAALAFEGGSDEASTEPYERVVAVGDVVDLPGGWRLSVRDAVQGEVVPSAEVCVLDAAGVTAPLVLRNRRAGDRLRLLGLGGHTSIKRLFITRRVPRALRAAYPLLLLGDEIVWVPGCGRGEAALVGADTRRVLVVRVEVAPAAARSA